MSRKASTFGGILLVAGTTIGGGMLALPVLTSLAGFLPSLLLYFLCWLFMAGTGLLFLEISDWMHQESNIVSMAEKTLGIPGKVVAWCVYIFLFYSLTLAYVAGGGGLFVELFQGWLPVWAGSLVFVGLFAPFVYAGPWVVGRLNIFLMCGLALFYVLFVCLGAPYVDSKLLAYQNWNYLPAAFPIAFAAFAYQGIIPTLVTYMHQDYRRTRIAIVVGSFIPLVTYIIWQWLILGIVPAFGEGSLHEALKQGSNAVQPLKNVLDAPYIYAAGQFFAFFALVTSFFGVTLGLLDFLADGLQIPKDRWGCTLLCLAIFVPPLLIAHGYPHVFLIALEHAGGIGCAILLGLLPILMTWKGRYQLNLKAPYQLPGGRWTLGIMLFFVLIELCFEGFVLFNKFS